MKRQQTKQSSLDLDQEIIKCDCQEHSGTQLLNKEFNLNVDYLYECLYTDNDFNKRINEARRITDVQAEEWIDLVEDDRKIKQRKSEYNVGVDSVGFGKRICKSYETSKMLAYEPGKLYVVESESITVGIPYSDAFKVRTRICIIRGAGGGDSNTKVMAHVAIVYIQKPMFVIKKFIDKNAMGTIAEYFVELDKFLVEESSKIKNKATTVMLPPSMSNQNGSSSKSNENETPPASVKKRVPSGRTALTTATGENNATGVRIQKPPLSNTSISSVLSTSSSSSSTSSVSELSELVAASGDSDNQNIETIQPSPLSRPPETTATRNNKNIERKLEPNEVENITKENNVNYNRESSLKKQKKLLKLHTKRLRKNDKEELENSDRFLFIGFHLNNNSFLNIFFIIMLVLLVFNLMLYYKLNEIEGLAKALKKRQLVDLK